MKSASGQSESRTRLFTKINLHCLTGTKMKAIIQRVTQASVTVDGEVVSSIGRGFCVLVGIGRKSEPKQADWLVRKILNLRLFDGEDGRRWDKSVMDKKYEILCVSQFTLHTILKGNKPDFHDSMSPDTSQEFYECFLQKLRDNYGEDKIKDGVFGANMQVHIQNDGPVTIPLEAPEGLPEPKVRKPQGNTKKSTSSASLSSTASSDVADQADTSGATGDDR